MKIDSLSYGQDKIIFNKYNSTANNFKYRIILENIEFDKLNREVLTTPIALKPSKFMGFKHSERKVSMNFRLIFDTMKRKIIEDELYKFIKIFSKYEDSVAISSTEFYFNGVLENVDYSILNNTALIEIDFIDFDGVFYSQLKKYNNGDKIITSGKTDFIIIKIMPIGTSQFTIKDSRTGKKLIITPLVASQEITVDLKEKRVHSKNVNLPITFDSEFFDLNGTTTIIVQNVNSATIEVREVLI